MRCMLILFFSAILLLLLLLLSVLADRWCWQWWSRFNSFSALYCAECVLYENFDLHFKNKHKHEHTITWCMMHTVLCVAPHTVANNSATNEICIASNILNHQRERTGSVHILARGIRGCYVYTCCVLRAVIRLWCRGVRLQHPSCAGLWHQIPSAFATKMSLFMSSMILTKMNRMVWAPHPGYGTVSPHSKHIGGHSSSLASK